MSILTVKELVAKLLAMPQDAQVVMNVTQQRCKSCPDGLHDVREVGTLPGDQSLVYLQ